MRFAALEGAAPAAIAIGRWAKAAGFGDSNVEIVTDTLEDGPVTEARVQAAVDRLFSPGLEAVSYMLLNFCGHGLTGADPNSTFWLFSDAVQKRRQVNVDGFVSELVRFGVPRITVISDACREGPPSLDMMRYDAVRPIVGGDVDVRSPQFDRLASCQDGKLSYMVGDHASAAPGKCIFSGVIADVLWGLESSAIADGSLTTSALASVARRRTTERAKDYRLEAYPSCMVDPEPATLFDRSKPLVGEPQLQDWPAADAIGLQGALQDIGKARTVDAFDRFVSDADFRRELLGGPFMLGDDLHAGGQPFQGLPADAKPTLANLLALQALESETRPNMDPSLVDAEKARAIRTLESKAAAYGRSLTAASIKASAQAIALNWDDAGDWSLVVHGRRPRAIWSGGTAVTEASSRPGDIRFRIGSRTFRAANGQMIIETKNGVAVPFVAYRNLRQAVMLGPGEGISVGYGSAWSADSLELAFGFVAEFIEGKLLPEDIERLASSLRMGKHSDPILGVISAYLYRAIADFDSIRRMADFYRLNSQPVPFDIALLGEMPVRLRDGKLVADIPAVPARKPGGMDLPDYATRSTRGGEQVVGGLCPWLAAGWDYVAEPRHEWRDLVHGLDHFASAVPRMGFTKLPAVAGRELAEIWGLRKAFEGAKPTRRRLR